MKDEYVLTAIEARRQLIRRMSLEQILAADSDIHVAVLELLAKDIPYLLRGYRNLQAQLDGAEPLLRAAIAFVETCEVWHSEGENSTGDWTAFTSYEFDEDKLAALKEAIARQGRSNAPSEGQD